MTEWFDFDSAQDVALAAADAIEEHARHAIQSNGSFKLVLAGGTTPSACYQILAKRNVDRSRWLVFYGDERCLPLNDSERNHQMAMKTGLIDQLSEHFIIPAELGADRGAESYQQVVEKYLPFDMVLLGMGEDGHTASLFPGHNWESNDSELSLVLAVNESPKPPSERVSLSPFALQKTNQMLVLITGESKRLAVKQWREGKVLPVSTVASCKQSAVYVEKGLLR